MFHCGSPHPQRVTGLLPEQPVVGGSETAKMRDSVFKRDPCYRRRVIGAEQGAVYRIKTELVQKILRARIKSASEGVFQLAPADMESKANIRDSDRFCQSVTYPNLGPSCQAGAVIARQRRVLIGNDGFPAVGAIFVTNSKAARPAKGASSGLTRADLRSRQVSRSC